MVVLVSVGLREVAVALSNPFGRDDVDFPIDKWVAQLRSVALMVHPDNKVGFKPKPGDMSPLRGSRKKEQEEEEIDDEEDDDDGDGGGNAGGGGGGGDDDGDDGGGDDGAGF